MLFIPCIASLLSFIVLSSSLSPSFFSQLLFKALSVPLICQHLLLSDTLPSQRASLAYRCLTEAPFWRTPFYLLFLALCLCVLVRLLCECVLTNVVNFSTRVISSADSWVNFDCDILSVSPLGSRCRSKLVWTNVEVYLLTEMVKEKTEAKLY